jgi:intracellular septation protein A
MKNFLQAGRAILLDIAASLCFLALYALTHNLPLAVGLGLCIGAAQIIITYIRRQPIATLQWVSLIILLSSSAAALLTQDVRFLIIKFSIIYAAVGFTMLKPGWMDRYAPPITLQLMPEILRRFGFIWAALMFGTALLNLLVAYVFGFNAWLVIMPGFALISKCALFCVQYAIMRIIGGHRQRAGEPEQRSAA